MVTLGTSLWTFGLPMQGKSQSLVTSTDGVTWSVVQASLPWAFTASGTRQTAREQFGLYAVDATSKLFVVGGYELYMPNTEVYDGDVWVSP